MLFIQLLVELEGFVLKLNGVGTKGVVLFLMGGLLFIILSLRSRWLGETPTNFMGTLVRGTIGFILYPEANKEINTTQGA